MIAISVGFQSDSLMQLMVSSSMFTSASAGVYSSADTPASAGVYRPDQLARVGAIPQHEEGWDLFRISHRN